ncbi:MAG TPA: ISAs1 family transposase, partial [Pirellulales bacterium]|nr:ISAs1 family transposase [Pirellulales bacterium]
MQVDQEDIRQIMDDFATLEDPRCHINRKHLLGDLIVICMCAV